MNKQLNYWKMIDWKKANKTLKSLQAELYGALKARESEAKISSIENRILKSFGARALAVRRVTTNKGSKTRGIDNILWIRDEQKMAAIKALKSQNWKHYTAFTYKTCLNPESWW